MKFSKAFFSKKYSPFFKMVIQTLLIFVIFTIPLSINITHTPPPYTMYNTSPSGMSIFNTILQDRGLNTTRTILSTDPILNLPESSILVIAGGAKNYRLSEKEVINSYVGRGGTLLLLGGSGSTYDLANYFGIIMSVSPLLATENYYPTPDYIFTHSPATINGTLCFAYSRAILFVATSDQQTEVQSISTESTVFIDANGDRMWNQLAEDTRSYKVAVAVSRGLGTIVLISSMSFLTNDLYLAGFDNINLTISLIGAYTGGSNPIVCFEESHKRWPFASTEGIINQTYGSIILYSKTRLFVFIAVLLLLFFFYLTPRFQETFRTKESYKKFISKKIWSRRRELFDTFGSAINPTVEEKVLSYLYFQHELYPSRAYNYFILEKMKYVPSHLFDEEERELFELALTKKLDHDTFLFLFKRLEVIQKRRRYNDTSTRN
jgi:hypothetical protein